MADIDEIKRAISDLTPESLAVFRAWFRAFDAASFDSDIETAAESGKLNSLAEQALAGHRARRACRL